MGQGRRRLQTSWEVPRPGMASRVCRATSIRVDGVIGVKLAVIQAITAILGARVRGERACLNGANESKSKCRVRYAPQLFEFKGV